MDRINADVAHEFDTDPLIVAFRGASVGEVEAVEHPGGWAASVRPASVGELARAIGLAGRLGVKAAVTRRARPGRVALDLSRLDAVEAPDETACLIRVGAGATVRAVEDRAVAAGLTLGPMLPSSARKRVGAWLAGPTRGERVVPPGRLETAALALEAVLADGSGYKSREVPRSATGPDLDHLLLGGEGRFGILTRATLRLFPRALAEAAGAREGRGVLDVVEAARSAVHDGSLPAEVRWEKARGVVEARFTGHNAAQRARRFGQAAIGGREIHAHLELAGSWRAWAAASPLRPEAVHLVSLHVDGAFGALEFHDVAEAEQAAMNARHIGFAVVSPRSLRPDPAEGWRGAAAPLYAELASRLDPKGVLAP